ncbi:MAG: InlB B-repeat-containing protein [Oscillospiraceae bacterium]|nr:InlB B-repeat-containing protein [Oscillospiraceae bacterium]
MKRGIAILLTLVMVCSLLPMTASATWPPSEPEISGCEETQDGYHNFVAQQSREPTCTQSGLVRWQCMECGYIYDEGYAALGHDYVNGFCSRCGEADPNALPAGCTLHAGFTVMGGTAGATQSEQLGSATDDNDNTQWRVYTSETFDGAYIEFDTETEFVPVRYLLYTGANTQLNPARRPKSWVLKGKLFPEDDWTVIDTVTNDDTLPASPKMSAGFDVSSVTQVYRYFRLEITALRGGNFGETPYNAQSMELSEIRFYGTEFVRTYTWVAATSPTCTAPGRVACYACNDGGYYATQDTSNRLTGAALYPVPALGHDYDASGVCVRCGAQDPDASSGSTIAYVNASGSTSYTYSYATMASDTTDWGSRFYLANGDVTISDRVTVNGHARLILGYGATLRIPKGITVAEGSQLTVYRRAGGTLGKLIISNVQNNNAAIGGLNGQAAGAISLYGGEITVTGGRYAAGIGGGNGGSGGTVVIGGATSDCIVTANGGESAAAIGGGQSADGGAVTISGGRIRATGGSNAAGIGGGNGGSGGNITISGGGVYATNTSNNAAIGGGTNGAGGTIVISGGSVNFHGIIGAGASSSLTGSVTITGGQVRLLSVEDPNAGIGCGGGSTTIALTGDSWLISGPLFGTVTLGTTMVSYQTGLLVTQANCATIGSFQPHTHQYVHHAATAPTCVAPGNLEYWGCTCGLYYEDEQREHPTTAEAVIVPATGIHTVELIPAVAETPTSIGNIAYYRCTVCHKCFLDETYQQEIDEQETILRPQVTYLDENGVQQTLTTYVAITADTLEWNADATIGNQQTNGWFVVLGNVTLPSQAELYGNVKLVLPDGARLDASGLLVYGSLSIYAQSDGNNMGVLHSVSAEQAGIGYGSYTDGHSPDITITIYGGKIYGESQAEGCPGIGGNRCNMAIHGGDVTGVNYALRDANTVGITRGVGIGCACFLEYGYFHLTINGGTVVARGGWPSDEYRTGCGIGGWTSDDTFDPSITINGGTVTAVSGAGGAGIGGYEGNSGTIIIGGDANVTATGGMYGAGIGGGNNGGTNLTIRGSAVVNATGGKYGSGIGGGSAHSGGVINIQGGTVTATGGEHGAGIGGGGGIAYSGSGGTITISGGTVTATAGARAAGIGSGGSNEGRANSGTITISGGSVTAAGCRSEYYDHPLNDYYAYAGAGIGGGAKCGGGTITISGGTVDATGGSSAAAAIGGGYNAPAGTIAFTGGAVNADGKIGSGADYTPGTMGELSLTWTARSDTFYARSYENVSISFQRGFVLQGTETAATAENIANHTIVPAAMLSYDAGEGSGTMAPTFVAFGGTVTVPACGFTEPLGKEFDAWTIDGVRYTAGSNLTLNEDRVANAQWKYRWYSITCNVSGGTLTADSYSAKIGDTITLTATPAVGHVFTENTMQASYTDGENNVQTLTLTAVEGSEGQFTFEMPAGPVTASATFTALDPHTYTFTPGISTGAGIEEAVFTTQEYTIPACTFPVPAGMHFLGWKSNDIVYQPGDVVTVTVDASFTAQWGYIASFRCGEGSGTMEDVPLAVLSGTTVDYLLPDSGFTAPANQVFVGWYGNDTLYPAGSTVTVSADVLFTAKWAANTAPSSASFTVTNSGNTFTVTRSGNLSNTDRVIYQTVSQSALAGVHFRNVYGTLTFSPNETTKTVTVTEYAVTDMPVLFRYQNTGNRTYRFEVLDQGGFVLANLTRTITYASSYRFSNNYVSNSVTDLVYLNGSTFTSGMNSSKYYNVSATSGYLINGTGAQTPVSVSDYQEVDDGYDYKNLFYVIPTDSFYSACGFPKEYYEAVGDKLYATVMFHQIEWDDGYQYIQILADNTTSYDDADGNGTVSNPSVSLYKACFIMTYTASASTTTNYWFFPHRYDDNDSTGGHHEFYNSDNHLYKQAFKNSNYRAANAGALVLNPGVSNLVVRVDAAGSGDDTWLIKNLKARYALEDATAPAILSSSNNVGVLDNGPHYPGNKVTISIPFSEIVVVTGTPTLSTSWGNLSYSAGSNTNVLSFTGTITAPQGTRLMVNSISGTIKDMIGNSFATGNLNWSYTATVGASQPYTLTYDLAGGTVSPANPATYTYETAAITLRNPTKAGYTFIGWTGTELNGFRTTVTIANHSHGNRIYTANWIKNEYAITYDLSGGHLPTGGVNPETYNIESGAITLTNPEREGYAFTGWTGTDLAEATVTVTIPSGSTGNRSYTATWRRLLTGADITVSIPAQEYTCSALTPVITVTDGETTLVAGTHYTVGSWSGDLINAGTYTATLTGIGDYDGTATATFTISAKPVTVTAKAQNVPSGSIATGPEQAELTGAVDGHVLASVDLTADAANGVITPSSAVILDGAADVTANYAITYVSGALTFNAVYTVSFEKNTADATGTMTSVDLMDGTTYTLPQPGFTANQNRTFREWLVTIGSAAPVHKAPGETITVTADTVVTAVYSYEGLRISAASLTLHQDIVVNFTAAVPAGMTNPYVVVELNSRSYEITQSTEDTQGNRVFAFTDLTPDQMGDNLKATLYATADSVRYEYCLQEYSVKQYCTNVMAAHPEDTNLQTLLADILVYGAATQTFTGHNADSLVTAGVDLTAASAFVPLTTTDASIPVANGDIYWMRAGLMCDGRMSIYFDLRTNAGAATTVEVTINGRTTTYNYDDIVTNDPTVCRVIFHGVAAYEYGDPVTAVIKNNGTQVGGTLTYSVNSYVYSMQNNTQYPNLAALVRAICNYGKSAREYLAGQAGNQNSET